MQSRMAEGSGGRDAVVAAAFVVDAISRGGIRSGGMVCPAHVQNLVFVHKREDVGCHSDNVSRSRAVC